MLHITAHFSLISVELKTGVYQFSFPVCMILSLMLGMLLSFQIWCAESTVRYLIFPQQCGGWWPLAKVPCGWHYCHCRTSLQGPASLYDICIHCIAWDGIGQLLACCLPTHSNTRNKTSIGINNVDMVTDMMASIKAPRSPQLWAACGKFFFSVAYQACVSCRGKCVGSHKQILCHLLVGLQCVFFSPRWLCVL